uniref:Uncharacterized protein n=1 Tax=Oryza glumipatula TaxID=40148 RepID=A0A0D9ZUM1_9ORYZ
MAAMAAAVAGTKKKTRKTYTITRPRERFGRDWKRIEAFVATKTAIQEPRGKPDKVAHQK